jgi:serine/threonine protein phosphatase PrpC
VDEALNEASRRLFERARSDAAYAGMGTTMTLALAWNGKLIVGHVGDCRLYLLRDGQLQRLTADHTMAAEMVRRGELSQEEAERSHLSHALTRSIGGQPSVRVDTLCLDLQPGDVCLGCTDGLYKHVEDDEIAEHLRRDDLSDVPAALTGLANDRGGEDNITVVVFRADAEPEGADPGAGAERAKRRLHALSEVSFLRELSLPRLAKMLETMEPCRYEAGEPVLEQGDAVPGLYVLVRGDVQGLGSEPGSSFGVRSLTADELAGQRLRAREDSEVLFLGRAAFERMVRRHPLLGCRLLWALLAERDRSSAG